MLSSTGEVVSGAGISSEAVHVLDPLPFPLLPASGAGSFCPLDFPFLPFPLPLPLERLTVPSWDIFACPFPPFFLYYHKK